MDNIKQLQLLWKEIYLRFTSASPVFFVKLRKLCLTLATVCATLSTSGVEFEIYGISVTKFGAIMSAIAAIIASLAVENADELKEKLEA